MASNAAETQAARAAARARGAAAQMDRAKSLAATARELAMDAIVQGACAVLRTGPLASEYVQAMGSWSFTVIIPLKDKTRSNLVPTDKDGFFEEEFGASDDVVAHLHDWAEELEPQYVEHIAPFVEALKEFRKLHTAYSEAFGGTAAGNPMRFGATGPITRDW